MDAYNPFEDPTEETDVLTGQRVMPNVPRDPNDPREKLRSYLAQKMESEKKMMTPEYRQAMRAPQNELMESNRGLALQGLLQKSAAMLGTVGGKTASTAGGDDYLKQLQGFNADTMRGIEGERQQMQGMEDQRLKMMQYLADRQGTAEEKAAMRADRNIDRRMRQQKMDEDRGYRKQMLDVERQKAAAAAGKTTGQNEGIKALDRDYARDYNEYTSRGRVNALSSINRLEAIQKQLEKEANSVIEAGGGSIAGSLPDMMRSERSIELRDDTINAANATLKDLFGGLITDSERAAAAREFYNDKLDSASNAKRLKAKIEEMKDRIIEQDAKAAWFRDRGTLGGFKGTDVTTRPVSGAVERGGGTPAPAPVMDYDSMSDEELQNLFNQRVGGGRP
jgi:hypothetical protein